jgi:hypothetical protein
MDIAEDTNVERDEAITRSNLPEIDAVQPFRPNTLATLEVEVLGARTMTTNDFAAASGDTHLVDRPFLQSLMGVYNADRVDLSVTFEGGVIVQVQDAQVVNSLPVPLHISMRKMIQEDPEKFWADGLGELVNAAMNDRSKWLEKERFPVRYHQHDYWNHAPNAIPEMDL